MSPKFLSSLIPFLPDSLPHTSGNREGGESVSICTDRQRHLLPPDLLAFYPVFSFHFILPSLDLPVSISSLSGLPCKKFPCNVLVPVTSLVCFLGQCVLNYLVS